MRKDSRDDAGGARHFREDGHRPAFEASGTSPPPSRQERSSNRRAKNVIGALPRLAVTPDEAAEMVGVGRSFFYEHILPDLRTVRRGRKRLIPVSEIKHYLDLNAARALG